MAPAGEVTAVRDEGTIWQMFYKINDNGLGVVNFDWRMLAQMYESESGRSFGEDYEFGDGVAIIQEYFIGRRIRVEGDAFDETVFFEDSSERSFRPTPILQTPEDYLRRYPRICSHIICHSLGYATPTTAARILMHADRQEPDYCEWIDSCYQCDARRAVGDAIRRRHGHHGYMADFDQAFGLVRRATDTGEEPLLGSWF